MSVATETEEYEGGARGILYPLSEFRYASEKTIATAIFAGNTITLVPKLPPRQSEKFKDARNDQQKSPSLLNEIGAEDIQKTFANPNSFYFKGVVFGFSPNEIGPSIMGEIELLLPYTEAQGLLKTEWLNRKPKPDSTPFAA